MWMRRDRSLLLVWARPWQRQGSGCRRDEALQTTLRDIERATSTNISMACRITISMSSIFTCRSSGTLRATSRLQGGQSFLLSPSRASCSWARNDNIGRCQILLRPKSRPHYGLQQRGVFSTSIRRNADGKAEKNVTSQGLSEHKQEVGHFLPQIALLFLQILALAQVQRIVEPHQC